MLTTHILDTTSGKPVTRIPVKLYVEEDEGWVLAGEGWADL